MCVTAQAVLFSVVLSKKPQITHNFLLIPMYVFQRKKEITKNRSLRYERESSDRKRAPGSRRPLRGEEQHRTGRQSWHANITHTSPGKEIHMRAIFTSANNKHSRVKVKAFPHPSVSLLRKEKSLYLKNNLSTLEVSSKSFGSKELISFPLKGNG